MNALSGIYGRIAQLRRAWYQPRRQRHLECPVISVGNLVVGGSGKTPVVAALARTLLDLGERPAILSRGYGRRSAASLIVVSDGHGPLVSTTESGDEPQMLARALTNVPILVGADRYRAGRIAETRLRATVHVLDDGFQHVRLARDVDLLLMSVADLDEPVLPAGRLREPLGTASHADAVLVCGSPVERTHVQSATGVPQMFEIVPSSAELRHVSPFGAAVTMSDRRVLAVAGIARPERFVSSLTAAGFDVTTALNFRDHHWFTDRDVQRIERQATADNAASIVTTEKDAVRIEPLLSARGSSSIPWTYLPYEVRIEPSQAFSAWLAERLAIARRTRTAASA